MAEKPAGTVGFRLTPEDSARLTALAERAQVSIHEMARRLVVQGLAADGRDLAAQIRELRKDVAVALETFLVATHTLPPEEARRFVEEKLS